MTQRLQIAWVEGRTLYSLPGASDKELDKFNYIIKSGSNKSIISNYELEMVTDYPDDMQKDLTELVGNPDFVKDLRKLIMVHRL